MRSETGRLQPARRRGHLSCVRDPDEMAVNATSLPYGICAATRLLVIRSRMKTTIAIPTKRMRAVFRRV